MAANPYLERLQTPANPYLSRLRERSDEIRTEADIATQNVSPDQYAEAIRTGKAAGIPTGVAVENLPTLKIEAEQAERRRAIDASPVLARWLESTDNTAVSRDDLRGLLDLQDVIGKPVVRSEEFSESVRQIKGSNPLISWDQARAIAAKRVTVNNIDPLVGATTGREATFGNYIRGLGESVSASFRQARAGLEMQMGDAFGSDEESPALRDYMLADAQLADAMPAFETDTARGVFSGLQSTIQQAPGLAASFLTANPLPALGMMGAQVQGQAYVKYRERGGTPTEALLGSTGEAAVEVITERLPMGVFLNQFGKVGAARYIAEILAREIPGEQIATFAQDAIDTAVANPDKTWGEFFAERPDAAYQTLIATLTQTAVMGGASALVNRYAGDELRRQQAANYVVARVAASTADAAKLDALTEAAAKLKTTARSPDATAEFVRMAEAEGATELYIDVRQAMTLFQSDIVQSLTELSGDAQKVTEAIATGGDLVIPLDRYVSAITTRPDIEQIKRLVRFAPDRLSQADLESTDVAKVIDSIVGEYSPETEVDPVFDRVREQLIAAGRSKIEADSGARLLSDRYAARAERRGQGETAAQVFEASGVTVESGEGAGTLDQTQPLSGIVESLQSEGLTLDVSEGNRVITLSRIIVPEDQRGSGIGTRAMQELIRYADATGQRIALSPSTDFGASSVNRLRDFYKRFGFKDNKGRSKDFAISESMIREPGRLNQADGARGFIDLSEGRARIVLTSRADKSTFLHESAHLWLFEMIEDAAVSPAVARDLDSVLEWFGLEVRTADGMGKVRDALRVDVARELHEKWARGFEQYLRSGKAPTDSLTEVFAKFRRWLTELYKSLTSLQVELTPEVTAVMDRLIATDEAIADAAREQDYVPVLPVSEMRRLGMSEARANAYAKSLDEARAELTARVIQSLERQQSSERRKALKRNREAVDAETRKSDFWNAVEILARGKRLDDQPVPAGVEKLNVNELSDPAFGYAMTPDQLANLRKLKVYTTGDDGISADFAAAMLNFPSGQAMLEALSVSPTRKEFIREEAERRTQAEFPDVLTDGTLKTQAMEALHNNKQAKALQAEIELLAELARQPAPPARFVREAASRIIAGKTLKDARPAQYLAQERRAAREATKLAAAGKYAEALVAKRRQALNAALYSEALTAQRDVEKLDRLMKRLDKKSTRENVAKGGQEFLIQLDQLRVVYGYTDLTQGISDRWAALRAFVDRLQEAGEVTAVSDRVIEASERRAVREDVSISELRELRDATRNLMTLASQANKVRKGDELVDREQAIEELVAAAEKSGIELRPLPKPAREMSPTERGSNFIDGMANNLLRPENLFEALDGGESGPWHDFWFAALDRAEKTMQSLRRRIGSQLKALRSQVTPQFLATLSRDVTIRPGLTIQRARLLALVLNTGNAGNSQRVMTGGLLDDDGNPVQFTSADLFRLRELLTDEELTYAQGLWDAVNSLWPDIVELQRRVSGVPVDKVNAESFTVRGKTYRGGYWPLVYDRNTSNVGEQQANDDALRIMMGQGTSQAFTSKGYQKARAEEFSAPLLLDFGAVLARHVDQVMTDIAYREPVKHISGLLRSERVKAAVLRRFGQAGLDNLKGQLAWSVTASNAVAGQTAREWRRFSDSVLSNMSVSALAIRPDIALGNYASSLIQGLDRTGVKALLRGLWQQNASRNGTAELVRSKSTFMSERLDEVDHWYNQELRWANGDKIGGFGAAYRRVMMTLHRVASFEAEKAIWAGRYLSEREKGTDEAEAIRLADKTIRQTQTANERKDVSTFERDNSFRQTRQFMGPMFVIFGRLNEAFRGTGNSRTVGERAVRIMLQVFLAPALFALAAGRWPDEDDEEEEIGKDEWAVWLAANCLLFPLQTLPLLRDIATAAEALLTDNPVNPRAAPVGQAIGQMAKAGKSIARNIEQYGDTEELNYFAMTRDLTAIAGPLVGVPASQIRITSRGIEAALDDTEDDRGLALMMLYGPPRP